MPKLKKSSEKGTEFVATRLTGDEKREVDELAAAEGLTLSDFLREAIADRIAKAKTSRKRKSR